MALQSILAQHHSRAVDAFLQVPARPDQHMLRGCRYTATGTQMQLQQLAAKLISQAIAPAASEQDADLKQWCYLNEQVCCCTPRCCNTKTLLFLESFCVCCKLVLKQIRWFKHIN
jgi:hypothetical protein